MQNIIGPQIQQIRKNNKLTQSELAARLQIHGFHHTRNTIAKIETGVRQVTDIEVKAFSEILNVPLSSLFESLNEDH